MNRLGMVIMVVSMLGLAGCAKVVGPYYLESERYEEGIRVLGEEYREHPDDASAAYYLGRYYLALHRAGKGLAMLQKAEALDPDNADYAFWTGVAHWAVLDTANERRAYQRAIALDPKHISANLYLGHGYIDDGQWARALAQYDTVLDLDEYNPEALYNRAAALHGLGRTKEEIAAWKKFLEYYPDGSLAMQAAERLNLQGNFTYRNFIVGQRNLTLRSVTFKPGTDTLEAESKPSLHVIKAMLQENDTLALHIVAYADGDKALAKERATAVREYMLNGDPYFDRARLPLSWFGVAEEVELGGNTYSIHDSVTFITAVR